MPTPPRRRLYPRRFPPGVEAMERRALLATIVVSNINDSGEGSLRSAIAEASDGDVIDLTGLSGMIDMRGGELAVPISLTIKGPGSSKLTIDPSFASRIFDFSNPRATDEVDGLDLENGAAAGASPGGGATGGGAILSSAANLTISGCLIGGSESDGATAAGGGLQATAGSVTIIDSVFADDQALANQAGSMTALGGGVDLEGASATLTNVAFLRDNAFNFSGSRAAGGGLYDQGTITATTTLSLTGCLFDNDSAYAQLTANAFGGGLAYLAGAAVGDSVSIAKTTFTNDHVQGGVGGAALSGGGFAPGGAAFGGGLYINAAQSQGLQFAATGSVFRDDRALGGAAGVATAGTGNAGGGGVEADASQSISASLSFSNDDLDTDSAIADGVGKQATSAVGGGLRLDYGDSILPSFALKTDYFGSDQALATNPTDAKPKDYLQANSPYTRGGGRADGGGLAFLGVAAYRPSLTVNSVVILNDAAVAGDAY